MAGKRRRSPVGQPQLTMNRRRRGGNRRTSSTNGRRLTANCKRKGSNGRCPGAHLSFRQHFPVVAGPAGTPSGTGGGGGGAILGQYWGHGPIALVLRHYTGPIGVAYVPCLWPVPKQGPARNTQPAIQRGMATAVARRAWQCKTPSLREDWHFRVHFGRSRGRCCLWCCRRPA